MKKFAGLTVILFIFIGCFLIFGCATTMPINDGIIRDTGGYEHVSLLQFYLSKTITLKMYEERGASYIEGGKIKRMTTERKKITLKADLPGVARAIGKNVDSSLNYPIGVSFEEYEGNFPVLYFGKAKVGSQEKFYLMYLPQYPGKRIVQYGNSFYKVSFFGNKNKERNQPYLLVKGTKGMSGTSAPGKAGGLTR